jgi:hypothetical protein
VSHLSSASLAYLNIKDRLENVKRDESGGAYISVPLARYTQAAPIPPAYRTLPAKLLRFNSFDGLEIPCMYYHPNDSNSVVPVVISIHGGPEGNFLYVSSRAEPDDLMLSSRPIDFEFQIVCAFMLSRKSRI